MIKMEMEEAEEERKKRCLDSEYGSFGEEDDGRFGFTRDLENSVDNDIGG